MENFKPTLDDPMSDQSKNFEKSFDKTMMTTAPEVAPALNEVDGLLTEREQSLKKKIWSLAKMEALVFADPKLSAVYEEMAENGEEKYGYHYNETIQNMIFNDYVLNSPQYLQKYKMAIPKEKKRRDKSGINQLKKAGEKKMDATGTKLVTPKEESVEESTSAGSAAGGSSTYVGYAGPSAWAAKGDLSGDFKGKKKATDPKATPISTGFALKETNYLTDPSGFEKYVEIINEEISLEEKAKSKSQQRFMGMVNAYKNGDLSAGDASADIEAAADSMTDKEVDDFASTKHKGLPDHVKENNIKETKITENMEQFTVTVKHDNGTKRIMTSASSEEAAREKIMNAENCPASAIINVSKAMNEDPQSIVAGSADSMKNVKEPAGDQGFDMDMGMQSGGMNEDMALLEEINNELTAFETHHNKLKLMAEEKKTTSQILNKRVTDDNPKNFKKDLGHSGTKDIIDVEKQLQWKDQQTDVPKDPQKLGADIEKQEIKTADMEGDEALKNVGDSTNNDGDEIPKRNLTTKEQDEVDLYRNGQHSLTYDNEPGERFVDRMKADQGKFFDIGEKQKAFKADAPMYNKDNTFVEDAKVDKTQFDKNVKKKGEEVAWNERMGLGSNVKLAETLVTGRYKNYLGKSSLIEFRLGKVIGLVNTDDIQNLNEINFAGLGNTYLNKSVNKKVVINEGVVGVMGKNKFYTDGKDIFALENPAQNLNEGEVKTEKPVISEQEKKMKHLLGYKPQNYIDTKNITL